MKMASLSIYRGILNRTVPAAFYRLLRAEGEEEFLKAWGNFFAVLCERGLSESFADCLTGTALFDENAFSLAAAGGAREFPPALLKGVERDPLSPLRTCCMIPPSTIPKPCISRPGEQGTR